MNAICDDVLSGHDPHSTQTRLYPGMVAGARPLQAVLLVPQHSPRWIADLAALAHAGLSVIISVVTVEGDFPARIAPELPLDMRVYLALERFRHRKLCDRLTRVDLCAASSATLSTTDSIETIVARVSSLHPDLVLFDGPENWQSALAAIARYGCWQIDSSLLHARYAGLSLLLPVLARSDTSAIDLVLANDKGAYTVLVSSVGTTHPGSFRLQRNRAFAKLSAMLLRSLRHLAHGELILPDVAPTRLLLMPTARFKLGQGIRAFLIALRHTLHWQIVKRRPEDLWLLLIRRGKSKLDPFNPRIDDGALLVAPRTDYWADPCVVEQDGRRLIFAEEYPLRTRKAVIVCLELFPDGRAERLGIALDQTCHLSYPQAFQWNDQWYLTVESGTARCVRLYRASDFPLRWQPVTDLINDRICVDPTLHYQDGHWYLFVNISESGGSTSEELFLFVSEQLVGPYRPHPANPIVSDVRRARPAGRLFEHEGRLIRPGQDCAASYGNAIVFCEVLELTPERYGERVLARLDGSWSSSLDGCHTYSEVRSLEVLDARGKVPANMLQIPVTHAPVSRRASAREVPLVSVLMASCDAPSQLCQAIENVFEQSFSDHEILIACNDPAATALQIDATIAEHRDRVRLIHVSSSNPTQSYNAAMAQARGRYLAWYDVQYRWVRHHLEDSLDLLERNSALGMVHAHVLAHESAAELFGRSLAREHVSPRFSDPYAALLLWHSHPLTAAVVARRSTALVVGSFDDRFACHAHSERDFWLRIAEIADIGEIAVGHATTVLARDRTQFDVDAFWSSRRMLVEKHIKTVKGRVLRQQALTVLDADHAVGRAAHAGYWGSLSALMQSLRRHPWRWRVWNDMLRWALRLPKTNNDTSQ